MKTRGDEMEPALLLMRVKKWFTEIDKYNLEERIQIINAIRAELSQYSPFSDEPVDCVPWQMVTLNQS